MSADSVVCFPWNLSEERLAELAAQIDLTPIFEGAARAIQERRAAPFLPATQEPASQATTETQGAVHVGQNGAKPGR